MDALIQVSGVVLAHGSITAVEGLDLTITPGTVTALIGGDGAGKSTTIRALAGRVTPTAGTIQRQPDLTIGVVPERGAVFTDLTVAENLDFAARVQRRAGGDDPVPRDHLLSRIGLTGARGRLAGALSGGMRQKLALGMALQHHPAVLLLDEPTSGVDPVSRADLWRLLAEEVADGTAVVMATTYLDEAARASHAVLLDRGRILRQGPPTAIRDAVPGCVVVGDAPVGAHAWRRGQAWHSWVEAPDLTDHPAGTVVNRPDLEDAAIIAALQRDPVPAVVGRAHAAAVEQPAENVALVAARGLGKRFGSFTAVADVELTVQPGRIVGLLGANGAGKTTLLRMLLGLLRPSEGTTTLLGRPPDRAGRARVGYVPQSLGLYDDLTVAQNWRFHAGAFGLDAPPPDTVANETDRLVGDLSLGQQRRLAFAVARSHSPELLVLDEPTSGVGPLGRARLWDDIHDAAEGGMGVLVTTHYLSEAEQCDELVVMADGKVVARGTVADVVGNSHAVEVATSDTGPVLTALTRVGLSATLAEGGVAVPGDHVDPVRAALLPLGVDVGAVRIRSATLEERFVQLTRP